ncbi:MAG TPA: hypothetical protein VJ417_16020, partial [Candidatus Glassbacteria bacterium]|nr:hypothetical protein [Candidatus Glassbacteria bacterium]
MTIKLKLDGRQLKSPAAGGETLSEMIKAVEAEIAPERVIVSMNLDGKPLDRKGEREQADMPVERFSSLEVSTQNVNSLARSTLSTLTDYLPQLIESMDTVVEQLHSGQESEGHLGLSKLIDGFGMVTAAWRGIAHFIVIEDVASGGLIPDLQSFFSKLENILEAQKNN